MIAGITASQLATAGIVFVGGKSYTWVHATPGPAFDFTGLTGGVATSPSIGDYLLIVVSQSEAIPALVTTPAGVAPTPIVDLLANSFQDNALRVWEGIYESASSNGGQFNTMSAGRAATAQILVFRNARRGASAGAVRTENSVSADPPVTLPALAGSIIVVAGAGTHNGADVDYNSAADLANIRKVRAASAGYRSVMMTGQKLDWSGGPFNPATFSGIGDSPNFSANACTIILVKATETVSLPNYANPGGTGNRTGSITISKIGTYTSTGAVTALIDGSQANVFWWANGVNDGTQGLHFDFGTPRIIGGFRWYQDGSPSHGVWRLEGSADNNAWTQIGEDFILGGANTQNYSFAHTGKYRYHRLRAMSGNRVQAPYLREIEFDIAA